MDLKDESMTEPSTDIYSPTQNSDQKHSEFRQMKNDQKELASESAPQGRSTISLILALETRQNNRNS
jgi:hypothetical protein